MSSFLRISTRASGKSLGDVIRHGKQREAPDDIEQRVREGSVFRDMKVSR
jgi:hypothetical protein